MLELDPRMESTQQFFWLPVRDSCHIWQMAYFIGGLTCLPHPHPTPPPPPPHPEVSVGRTMNHVGVVSNESILCGNWWSKQPPSTNPHRP